MANPLAIPVSIGRAFFDEGAGLGMVYDDSQNGVIVSDLDNGPTDLRGLIVFNTNAATEYLHLWDDRGPTLGTTPQDFTLPMASSKHLYVAVVKGGRFRNGLSYACTSDTGTIANTPPAIAMRVTTTTTGGLLRAVGDLEIKPAEALVTQLQVTTLPGTLGGAKRRQIGIGSTLVTFKSSATTGIHAIRINNKANSVPSYLKLWNAAAPTVGTTVPNLVMRALGGEDLIWTFGDGGLTSFTTAVTGACVTTGGTGGTVSPTNAVTVDIVMN